MHNVYDINPFEQSYYEQEKNWFLNKCKEVKTERLQIEYKNIQGRLSGFMYQDFVDLKDVPVFYIDGKVWMSITPMEVESHFIPIDCALGTVGVAGLGIGYYVQRILEKEDVDSVTVFELDQDVIDLYLEVFGDHPKLSIIQGDVLETCKDHEFDWFYNDIYGEMFEDSAFEHMKTLKNNNYIVDYHFWTMEGYVLAILNEGSRHMPSDWKMRYIPFIIMLLETKNDFANSIIDGEVAAGLINEYTQWEESVGIS